MGKKQSAKIEKEPLEKEELTGKNENENKDIPAWAGIVIILALVLAFVYFFFEFQRNSEVGSSSEGQITVSKKEAQQSGSGGTASQISENISVGDTASAGTGTTESQELVSSDKNIDFNAEIKKLDDQYNLVDEDDYSEDKLSDSNVGL